MMLGIFASCSLIKKKRPTGKDFGEGSTATGVAFQASDSTFHPDQALGDPKNKLRVEDIKSPSMILIEGGRTVLGFEESEFTDVKKRNFTATVESFYMDEAEVANIHWLEYLHFQKNKSLDAYLAALPDTHVWFQEFSFNDYYVENYLRHPSFRFYPVVGVSWLQANDFCEWRSDPVILPFKDDGDTSKIQLNDTLWVNQGFKHIKKPNNGPDYRLPTEAEWIYAAQSFSYLEPYIDEKEIYKRRYPWDGDQLRNPHGKKMGYFLGNFKRGRGDYGGIAGRKNDGSIYTNYIYSYPPNDLGLYNMAGNVNEWVYDIFEEFPMDQPKFEINKKHKDESDTTSLDDQEEENQFQEFLEEERFRVYKGGSWRDHGFWLSPGTRRFLAEDSSTSTIGFRCVISSMKGN